MKKNNLHEVEDPNAEYYEPKPEGEKNYWKKHIINKIKDRNGNGSDVFSGAAVKKDKSQLKGDPKADLDGSHIGNRPIDEIGGEKGTKSSKAMQTIKNKTASFKERYGDDWKDAMHGSRSLDEDLGTCTIDSPGNKFHGKKGKIFYKHEDGRVNVQVQHGLKSGDVSNLTLKPDQFKMNEDSQAASSDNPASGVQGTTGTIDNNNSHLNNNPTGDPPKKGDVKNTLEKIAMQAAELHDKLEDSQEIDSQAQSMLNEARDSLDQACEIITNSGDIKSVTNKKTTTKESLDMDKEDFIEAMFNFLIDEGYIEKGELSPAFYAAAARGKGRSAPTYKGTNRYTSPKLKMTWAPGTGPNKPKPTAEDFEYIDDSEEVFFEEVDVLDEATVKDTTGTIIGTHRQDQGFKPNALGRRLGHKAHPTDVPSNTTITKRGRKVGSKSFGASKRKDLTSDEAGAHSEKPSFTDQLLKATDDREGSPITFDNGETHHVPRVHARAGLYHLGKAEKPADKDKVRKHIGASKANFDAFRRSGGQLPKEAPAYDPDARIKAKTSKIVSGSNSPRPKSSAHAALAQKILARRRSGK